MRLFEHADFEQAILRAAEHFRERKLRPAIIEKDYYVTEALRFLATTSRDKIIFKGGTSLAKGWNLPLPFDNSSSMPYGVYPKLNHSRDAWIVPK